MKLHQIGNVTITKDVIALTDTLPDGTEITKFFDESQNFLGARGDDGRILPALELKDNIGFLSELDAVSKNNGVSLEDLENKGDAGISLDNEDMTSEKKEQNEKALEGLGNAAKQEIDLDKKIDTKHTLAEILGVQAGSKLIVVNSDMIKDNINTTRFSCLIESPNGELSPADMLKQTGGKYSDKKVHEVNNDGSSVNEVNVQSSYAVDSEIVENGILNVRFDTMGEITVDFGQTDRTSHRDAFTQRLETDRTYPIRRNVQREFDEKNGLDNIPEKMDEIEKHKEHGCDNLTLKEADGDLRTRTFPL